MPPTPSPISAGIGAQKLATIESHPARLRGRAAQQSRQLHLRGPIELGPELSELTNTAEVFAFIVPDVTFRVQGEHIARAERLKST